jgi:hypothetical protein
MRCVLLMLVLLAPVSAQVPTTILDQSTALRAEAMLRANPGNTNLAGLLLDYYLFRWNTPQLQAPRLHLLLWIIANRPEIDLANAVHDYRGLNVDPDDKDDYAQVRAAWMKQTVRQPNNARVLANAAMALRLTDRKQAARWLKNASTLDTETIDYERLLATVYADALTGVAAMDPQESPTRLDAAETKSPFVKEIRNEIEQDANLCGRTGWAVHLIAMALRGFQLTTFDYDTVAEELLINAANLDYPKPTKLAFLGQFYRDQSLKVTHKILPKFPEVEVKSKEAVKTLVEAPKRVEFEGLKAARKVSLNVTVGIDGHVWKAAAPDGSQDPYTSFAASAVMDRFTFKPLRVSGEPMVSTTSFDVTLEPPAKPAK